MSPRCRAGEYWTAVLAQTARQANAVASVTGSGRLLLELELLLLLHQMLLQQQLSLVILHLLQLLLLLLELELLILLQILHPVLRRFLLRERPPLLQ
jgi:hypothetical protein